MIRYRLACTCGEEFEAWFASSRAFDQLAGRSALQCPACGGSSVSKAVMAPQVVTRKGRDSGSAALPVGGASPADPAEAAPASPMAMAHRELMAAARRLREEIKAKADYVGPRFAEEARRIDSGEAPDRGIYGEATREEARELIDEGIAILPLPRLPEEQN